MVVRHDRTIVRHDGLRDLCLQFQSRGIGCEWREEERGRKRRERRVEGKRNQIKGGAETEEGREEVGHDNFCCTENDRHHMALRSTVTHFPPLPSLVLTFFCQ